MPIAIISPLTGVLVPPSFATKGTVEPGSSVTVTLQSSLNTVSPINQNIDGSSGNWSCSFAVDSSNYPSNSTLTATIANTVVAMSINIRISNSNPGGG